MPRETVQPRNQGTHLDPSPFLQVGWGRDLGEVQIATLAGGDYDSSFATESDHTEGLSPRHLLESLVEAHAFVGEYSPSRGVPVVEEFLRTVQKDMDGWPRPGFWVDLDRDGINRLIRILRKARDAAYGADA